jgi:hypothetical protein
MGRTSLTGNVNSACVRPDAVTNSTSVDRSPLGADIPGEGFRKLAHAASNSARLSLMDVEGALFALYYVTLSRDPLLLTRQ